jgi:integrase
MPHFPKPFFKKSRGLWYVEIERRQIQLGPDKQLAFDRYHELMRSRPRSADTMLAVGVIDAYLEWLKQNRSARTYEWYQRHCQVFAQAIEPTLTVEQLKPYHVTQVLSEHASWSSTNKNGLCRAVQRAFRWAEEEELILRSPLRHLKKPKTRRRETIVTPEEFAQLLVDAGNDDFRDLLITAWETGARPQELFAVERRHVDLSNMRWVFPVEESKGKRLPRIVYLNERALEITRRRMARYPDGTLFRNADGEPWNRSSVSCAFARIQITEGLQRMRELGVAVEPIERFDASRYSDAQDLAKARATHDAKLQDRRKAIWRLARKHGKKFCLYSIRHSWCTAALRRGVDPLTVAILMGHSDPSMIAKVYQHLAHDPEFLRQATARATRPA